MEKSATTKKKTSKKEKVCPICGGFGYVRRERSIDAPTLALWKYVNASELKNKRKAHSAYTKLVT